MKLNCLSLVVCFVLSAALSYSPQFTLSIFSLLTLDCLDQMTSMCGSFQTERHMEATEIDKSLIP